MKRLLIVNLLFIILTLFCTTSFAKYNETTDTNLVYNPDDFYFESDLLTVDNETYILQTNTNHISVRLNNFVDKSNVSKVDIDYNVVVKKNGVEINNFSGQGTILKTEKYKELNFIDLTSGNYYIEAKSTSPYSKVLSATFVIPEENNQIEFLIVDDGINMVKITLLNNDYIGNLNIEWHEGLVPNVVDPIMKDAGQTSHTIIFTSNKMSLEIVLLKTNINDSYDAYFLDGVLVVYLAT